MNVTFVLPGNHNVPSGGVKIVYEYANRLCAQDYTINIVHTANSDKDACLCRKLRLLAQFAKSGIRKKYSARNWFEVDPRINIFWAPSLAQCYIPAADVVIATAWQTAEWVADYPASKGRKFYFIQHKETWSGQEGRVMATWRLPLQKIVVSRWLQSIAYEMGESAAYVPNGLDFNVFGTDIPMSKRDPQSAMMLYHDYKWKGVSEGLQAMKKVKQCYPDLQLTFFGVPDRPSSLPDWIEYYQKPSQAELRKLYNRCSIFLAPSWSEGWGLTGSEAMMCGAAVVATDIGGHREFAVDKETAFMVEPGNVDAMAATIISLIISHEERQRLATAGNHYIQQYSWDRAVSSFDAILAGNKT